MCRCRLIGDNHHSLEVRKKLRGRREPSKFRPAEALRRAGGGRGPDGGATSLLTGFTVSAPPPSSLDGARQLRLAVKKELS
jgi:hypothetical protein